MSGRETRKDTCPNGMQIFLTALLELFYVVVPVLLQAIVVLGLGQHATTNIL
jgi:hypothetical protein